MDEGAGNLPGAQAEEEAFDAAMNLFLGEVDPFEEAEFGEEALESEDEEWLEEDALDEVEDLHLHAMGVAEETSSDEEADDELPGPTQVVVTDYTAPEEWTSGPRGSGGWLHSMRLSPALATETHHFQAADALHYWPMPLGGFEVITVGPKRLRIWRFPPGESDGEVPVTAPTRLPIMPYSVTRSTDGGTIVVGGDFGSVMIYRLEPEESAADVPFHGSRVGCKEPERAVLRLQAFLTCGSYQAIQHNNMVNSVRFGLVNNKERLLAATQDGLVYVLDKPRSRHLSAQPGENSFKQVLVSPDALRQDKGRSLHPATYRTPWVDVSVDEGLGTMSLLTRADTTTVAFGSFRYPVNHAAPSPDGRFIAVVGDSLKMLILFQEHGYTQDTAAYLPFGLGLRPAHAARRRADELDGSQYCAWSDDSRLLAASCDTYHAVIVFAAPSFELLLRVQHTVRPALALTWIPSRPGLLAFSQDMDALYVMDVYEELRQGPEEGGEVIPSTLQRMDSIAVDTPPQALEVEPRQRKQSLGRLQGLAATEDGRLLVASQWGLVEYCLPPRWSLSGAQFYPAKFKQVVRTLLLCAHHTPDEASGPWPRLHNLPQLAVTKMLEHLAASFPAYLPKCAQRPKLWLTPRVSWQQCVKEVGQ